MWNTGSHNLMCPATAAPSHPKSADHAEVLPVHALLAVILCNQAVPAQRDVTRQFAVYWARRSNISHDWRSLQKEVRAPKWPVQSASFWPQVWQVLCLLLTPCTGSHTVSAGTAARLGGCYAYCLSMPGCMSIIGQLLSSSKP